MNVTDSSISISSGTAPVIASDQWYGSFSFTGCDINGVTFPESGITNITGATFGDGTTFTNSDETFNSDKTAFASAKLSVSEGCSLYKSGSSVEVTERESDPENVLRIGNVANHEQNVYTFQEAWEIARANSGTAYVFKLNENINITSGIIKNQVKTDVTIDLNGYTFTCKNKYYLVSYENGSTGSSLALISSREGGKLIVDCFVCIGSGAKSVVNVSCGSDDGYPITVDSVHATYGYLAYMAGNFKGGSTLNLSVKNGTYNLYHGLLFVNNYGTNANNVYKLDVSNSVVSMGNACIGFSGSFRAASGSYINAVNSTFKATEGTELILASAQWDGSLEFDNCRFEGIVFDQSTLASVSGAVFKEGCSFTNFGATFNGDKTAFSSNKLSCESGYAPSLNKDGSVTIDTISKVVGVSITLSDDISINFYVVLSEAHTGAVMRFTVNGEEVLVNGTKTDDGKWKYVFSGIGPQSMTVPVYAELMFDGEVIYTHDAVSVKSYSDALCDMSHEDLGITAEKLGELKVLVTNLLRYGACAQVYRGYNLENLADEGIDETLLIEFVNPNRTQNVGETLTPGMKFTGATVWFDASNSICIRFTVTDLENTTIRVNGVEYDSTHFNQVGESTYTFFTDPIPATQYQSSFVFELCLNGVVQQEAVYSIACYVTAIQSSSDETMKNLAKALYNYSVAALEYVS